MMGDSGPNQVPVPAGRDITGEGNILGAGNEFLKFLTGGERGDSALDKAVSGFNLPLQQLTDALRGNATGFLQPLIAGATEDSLSTQSTALRDIEGFLARQAGGKGQFGGNRLLSQATTDFAKDRSRIPLNIFTNTIQNFLPLLAQKVQAELGRAGVAGQALSSSQNFNRVSEGRQAQAINRTQAGLPPESKDLSGAGSALGLGLSNPGLFPFLGGAGAAGGGAAGAGALAGAAASDRRLKTDVQKIGTLFKGLNLYLFKYVWGTSWQVGLMADEVRKVVPEAVTRIFGFDFVYYGRVLNGIQNQKR